MLKILKESLKYKEGLYSVLTIVIISVVVYPLSALITNKNAMTMVILVLSFVSLNAVQKYSALIMHLRDQQDKEGQ